MRLCRNVGVAELRLVQPQCDPQSDDARRFANHARDQLATLRQFESLPQALADQELAIATTARVRDQRYGQAVSLDDLAGATQQRAAKRIALVFGNTKQTDSALMNLPAVHCTCISTPRVITPVIISPTRLRLSVTMCTA